MDGTSNFRAPTADAVRPLRAWTCDMAHCLRGHTRNAAGRNCLVSNKKNGLCCYPSTVFQSRPRPSRGITSTTSDARHQLQIPVNRSYTTGHLRTSTNRSLEASTRHKSPNPSPNMPETRSDKLLVWIDCEMTGLDIEHDTIMSLACFITGPDLDILDEEGFETVIHHEKAALDRMNEWCTIQHGSSGLTKRCLASQTSGEEAARALLAYIKRFAKEPGKSLLAGNSVHVDKAFLHKPPFQAVDQHLHHRILDVSSLKEAARRWATERQLAGTPAKKGLHDARADILESIEEARYYQKTFFPPPASPASPAST